MQNLYFVTQSLLDRKISRLSAGLLLAAMLAALAGCGSGQAIPQVFPTPGSTTTGGTTAAPTVASVQLLANNTQLASSGTTTVDLTAVVLSATKQVIPGKTVTFSAPASPETAFINNVGGAVSGVSDANGTVTAKLNLGGNKLNRSIAISAIADSIAGTNSVNVTGTTLTVSGNTSLASGSTTTLTYSLKDSAGTGIPNISLTVTSTAGNAVCVRTSAASAGAACPAPTATTATGTTDASGQLIVDVNITAVATSDKVDAVINDPLTNMPKVSKTLAITTAKFSFQTLASTDIAINTGQNIQVSWTNPAAPVAAGTQVNFSTTRGTITNRTPDCSAVAATAVTDAAGNACASIASPLAGSAIITATGTPVATSPAATMGVSFVSRSVANVTVQAVPGTVAVSDPTSTTTQTNNISTITAVVRDAAGNLVKNAGITFGLTDRTGGKLSFGTARTDDTGSASVTYTAGTTSSSANGVTIKATVTDITNASPAITPLSSCTLQPGTTVCATPVVAPDVAGYPDAALTVASQPLLVRLGTDNKVAESPPNNQKIYAAVVTDASGNASVGTTVRFALRPSRYAKGQFIGGGTGWAQQLPLPAICANEDKFFTGIFDPSLDINGNGRLDPGGVATVTPSAVTDANGIAKATITYPKDHSYWVEVTLEARTGVVGNDPPTSETFWLPGPASDYNSITVAPPGQISPYGLGDATLGNNTCTNTL